MTLFRVGGVLLAAGLSLAQTRGALQADPPQVCDSCAEWNAPQAPFRVFGNTYYVGPAGLSSLLIASDAGLILLDGGLSQSAPIIDAGVRALGFRTEDIRLIVNSHAHYDHAAGIAALQRASGAVVAASAAGVRALAQGQPTSDDPQAGFGQAFNAFPPVANLRAVGDGEVLRVGDLAITAHHTPGHTPGSTSWSWQSCEGARCLRFVYADSLTAVSAPGFRFSGDATHPSIVDRFRQSIARVEALPCDVMISTHPSFTRLHEKLALRAKAAHSNPFVDPEACRAYAASARAALERRLADEVR